MKNIIQWGIIISFFICPTVLAQSQQSFTKEQQKLLILVHNVWKEVGYPETGQSILLQETYAGMYGNGVGDRHSPVGKRSYGIMQIKVITVRTVVARFPELKQHYFASRNMANVSDEEIIVMLITDNQFNATVAAKNFYLLMTKSNNDWARSVAAYNTGWGGAVKMRHPKRFKYVTLIERHLKQRVMPFNKHNNIR